MNGLKWCLNVGIALEPLLFLYIKILSTGRTRLDKGLSEVILRIIKLFIREKYAVSNDEITHVS